VHYFQIAIIASNGQDHKVMILQNAKKSNEKNLKILALILQKISVTFKLQKILEITISAKK
jgi:hypothetical protein